MLVHDFWSPNMFILAQGSPPPVSARFLRLHIITSPTQSHILYTDFRITSIGTPSGGRPESRASKLFDD